MKIDKYINQLEYYAEKHQVNLKEMFVTAGVPTSTYYRAINGVDLRFDTANRVAQTIRSISLQSAARSYQS